jgi:hypothetical protein
MTIVHLVPYTMHCYWVGRGTMFWAWKLGTIRECLSLCRVLEMIWQNVLTQKAS